MSQSSPAPESTQRTCIVCREVRSGDQLLQLGFDAGILRVGRPRRSRRTRSASAGMRGTARSAYVCVSRDCIERVGSKLLSHSLKRSVKEIDAAHVVMMARAMAERTIRETIGLARRMGILDVGADAALDRDMPLSTTIVATDAPDATRTRAAVCDAWTFDGSQELGRAAGMERVAVLRIRAGRLAHQAAYWLRVLGQTTSDEQGKTATTNGSREVA